MLKYLIENYQKNLEKRYDIQINDIISQEAQEDDYYGYEQTDSIMPVSYTHLTQDMNYGKIICKCELVDCIYMDEKFINEIKQNQQEYMCGDYQIGRYAWILEKTELIKTKIEAKGKLNIWNFEISQ